jgi:hypothetical protein
MIKTKLNIQFFIFAFRRKQLIPREKNNEAIDNNDEITLIQAFFGKY